MSNLKTPSLKRLNDFHFHFYYSVNDFNTLFQKPPMPRFITSFCISLSFVPLQMSLILSEGFISFLSTSPLSILFIFSHFLTIPKVFKNNLTSHFVLLYNFTSHEKNKHYFPLIARFFSLPPFVQKKNKKTFKPSFVSYFKC